jgi:hypothetical protein
MRVCVALIITHVDYEANARVLQTFRRTDGVSVSVVPVDTGLSRDALHALMRDSMATHVLLIGSVDEIASCEGYSIADDSLTTRPSVGRIGPVSSERALDARRACVQRQIDKIIAHDRAMRVGGQDRTRCVGVAADESRCNVPLLTGCAVMAHAMSVLETLEPRSDLFLSDGTRTWSFDDATETPLDHSPLPSSDYVFIVGQADTADRISVATPSGATPVVTTTTQWEDARHPIVFAFVSGRAISSFAESVVARVDGPCALCVFEATSATDHIQVVFTMWGILLSLRDAEDARLGDVVHSALTRTKRMMDIDCMRWSIRGDPCTRMVRSPKGSFDAVPPGTAWGLVDINGRPSGVCPLECVVHFTTPHSWVLSFHGERIQAQYDTEAGILVADTETDAETASLVVDAPSLSLDMDPSSGCTLRKSALLRCLRGATSLCVLSHTASPGPEMHIQTTTGDLMRWARLHTGNIDGASGCILRVDSEPFRLTNVACEWYVLNSSRMVSWVHTDEVRNDSGVVTARALAYSIVGCKATFDTVERYVSAASYEWFRTTLSFILRATQRTTTQRTTTQRATTQRATASAYADLEESVRQSIATRAGVLASNVTVSVFPFRTANSTETSLSVAASWVCLATRVKLAATLLQDLASNPQAFGLPASMTVSDIAVSSAHVDTTLVDAPTVDSTSVDASGIVRQGSSALHTILNLQLKANFPVATLFPDFVAMQAWLSDTASTLATGARVDKSRLQLGVLFTSNPYIFVLHIVVVSDATLALSLPILQQVLSKTALTLPMNAKYETYEVVIQQGRTTAQTQPTLSDATQYTFTAPPDVIYSTYDLLARFQSWVDSLAPSMNVRPDNVDLQVTISFDLGQIRVRIGARTAPGGDGPVNTQVDVKQVLNLPATVVFASQTSIPSGTLPLPTDSVPSNNDSDIIIDNEIVPPNEWCMCAIVSTSFIKYIDRIRHIYMQEDDGRFTLVLERNAGVLSTMLYKKVVWIYLA